MSLKKAKKLLTSLLVVTLMFSLMIPTKAEDTNEPRFDMNQIVFDVIGKYIDTKDDKDQILVTLQLKNESELDSNELAVKATLPNDSEFVKSDDSFEVEKDSIVLKNQIIKSQETKTYSYYLDVIANSQQEMSWYINDQEVKKINSIDDILTNKEDRNKAHQEPQKKIVKKVAPKANTRDASIVYNRATIEGNSGEAKVILEDGTTMLFKGEWSYYGEGTTIEVIPSNTGSSYKYAHGTFKNGVQYKISVKDKDGKFIKNPGAFLSVTITNPQGFDNDLQAATDKYVQINVITPPVGEKNPTVDYSNAIDYLGNKYLKTNDLVSVEKTSDKSIKINPISSMGEENTLVLGHWTTVDDTFESVGGKYNLGYILSHYNVFVEENYSGSHIVGSLVVGGTTNVSIGGLTSNDESFVNQAPSYFKGDIVKKDILVRSKDNNFPTYVGTGNKDVVVTNQIGGQTMPHYYTNNFVDFDKAFKALDKQSSQLFTKTNLVQVDVNNKTATLEKDGYKVDGTTVRIYIGKDYLFNNMDGISIDLLAPESATEEEKKNPLMMDVDTLILSHSTKVDLKSILVNNASPAHPETGTKAGLVFITPDATQFNANSMTGHVYAPNAEVDYVGGDYNGCVITRKSFKAAGEGHMMPYSGQELLPTSIGLSAKKLVNEETPLEDEKFTFRARCIKQPSSSQLSYDETITNDRAEVAFPQITGIEVSGEYIFMIEEIKDQDNKDYRYDGTVYYAKVTVELKDNQYQVTSVHYYQDYNEETEQLSNEIEIPTFKNTRIDKVGSLKIKKSFTGTTPLGDTTFTVTGPDGFEQVIHYSDFDNGEYTIPDLPIGEYTVTESNGKIKNYILTITGNGQTVTIERDKEQTVEIKNDYVYNLTKVSGTKTWDDNDNQDGKRPGSIIVNLYADGTKAASQIVTAAGNWHYTFDNLAKYREDNKTPIVYTITEKAVDGYDTTINGYNITNTHTPEKTIVTGTKTWNDANNQDGKRPKKITVRLLADGTELDSKVVTAEDNWAYTFDDLDKYEAGKEIVYTIIEDAVDEYDTTINGYDITNTHTPEKTQISGEKTWDDVNNQDGKRPQTITVNLWANGTRVASKEVSANQDGKWTYTFDNLDKYADGEKIKYTVTEKEVTGYETDIDGYNITNTHTPEKTQISGVKTWNDVDNQDGKRPGSITVNLLANGTKVDSKVVTAEDNWAYIFDNLDKYAGGQEIKYTVMEEAVDEYSTEVNGYDITNSYTPGKTSMSVTKIWDDANNQDGIRPEFIQVQLKADGVNKGEKVTLDKSNNWTYTWTDLDEKAAGKDIIYTVEEVETVKGYITKVDGQIITNTHIPEKTSVTGTKTWNDADNQDGKRPATIKVRLFANGKEVQNQEVTKDDNWTYTFVNLDKYEAGKEIIYTVTEDTVAGYETDIDGYDITNTHTPEKTQITGTKTWDDANDQDGKRPGTITVNLFANGTKVDSKVVSVNQDDEWTYTFDNLDKYEDGKEIEYTVTEDAVDRYTTDITGTNITNTHIPEKTQVSGEKTWNDADNQDGKRPESITVRLYADGTFIGAKEVTEEDNWAYTFDNLDKFAEGKEIVYTITEDTVAEYTTEVNGYDITNSYTPGKTSVSVTKTWNDADNQDGIRPESIKVQLKADGVNKGKQVTLNEANDWSHTWTDLDEKSHGREIIYTVEEIGTVTGYSKEVNGNATQGFSIINSHTPETTKVTGTKTWDDVNNQDGKRPKKITVNLLADGEKLESKVVTKEDNWTYTFDNLDKYKDGKEINYTVTEDAVDEYSTKVEGYDITNSYTPGQTSVTVTKVWDDANDQDGIRPEFIKVQLKADDKDKGEAIVLNADNNWTYTWTKLDEKAAGKDIVYTVEEVETTTGYKSTITGNARNGYTITNTHTPEVTYLMGVKTWDDANNQDGKRPDKITVRLLADGKEVDSKVVFKKDNWLYSFNNLDKYKEGKEIKYTVKEDKVEGYTTDITGTNITNTHTPETTEVKGTKTWDDANNQDGKRPETITVNLLADGEIVESQVISANQDGKWSYSFKDLPKYKEGKEIKYTVTEDTVDGYTTDITGTNITNTHTPETTEVKGTKTWNDANNQDGKRPDSITVNLLADGEKVDSKVVTEKDNWTYTFDNLDKYKDGNEIKYTVTEDKVKGYSTEVEGYDITNSYTPGKTSMSVTKVWDDANNQDGIRPESIQVQLKANGENKGEVVVLNESNDWTYTWTKLDEKAAGKDIIYTVEEVGTVEGYTTKVEGQIITNSHTPETIEVKGTKTWNDADNQDGKRPDSIIVRLLADGEEVQSQEVTKEDKWVYTFDNLPKYKDGKAIEYTVIEDEVEGYTTIVNGTSIINTHESEVIEVKGAKTWNDANNQDGKRPNSITVKLFADGEEVDSQVVTEEDNWAYTFVNLPKYKEGKEINYTVKENKVEGYTTKVDGTNIINIHLPETTRMTGTKTWDDVDNQDGKRPMSIIINLLANNQIIDSQIISEDNNWKYTFDNLPVYKNGTAIEYTVKEVAVDEYTTTINGTDITNTHAPETTEVKGTKTWNDANNQDGKRPDNITVNLLANDKKVDSQVVSADKDGHWTYTFDNLPVYEDGKEIKYTVTEDKVEGYDTTINDHNIINTHTPETTKVEGTKTWNDNNDQDGKRPNKITVNLLADGTKVDSKVVTEEDNWTYTFDNLDKYKDGKEIKYTVMEDKVAQYSTEVKGYNITNSYTPKKTSMSVMKIWDDANNQDGIRPNSIKVQLKANDKNQGEAVVLNEANGWSYTWTGLDEKAAGKDIIYTVEEVGTVKGYITKVEDQIITNSHKPETINVEGIKTWLDKDNVNKNRPESIVVRLFADNKEIQHQVVTKDDNWAYTFDNLPKYKDQGKEIKYTVKEDKVEGYTTTVDKYNLTNKEILGQIEIVKISKGNTTPLDTEFVIKGPNDFEKTIQYAEFNDGQYILKDIPLGTYSVEEKTSTGEINGYTLNATPKQDVTLEEGKTKDTITLTNTYTATQVKINKVDEQGNMVVGAKLSVLDKDGNVVLSFTSEDKAYEVTGILNAGETYVLHEEEAPKGYRQADDVEFTVQSNETVEVMMIDEKIPQATLIINKTDEQGNELYGATFKLMKVENDQEVMIEEQSGGPRFIFNNLEDGIYHIYETKAPEGYTKLFEYFEIEIIDGQIYYQGEAEDSFDVINEKDKTPDVLGDEIDESSPSDEEKVAVKGVKTSDDQNLYGYMGITFVSMLGAFFLLRKRKEA